MPRSLEQIRTLRVGLYTSHSEYSPRVILVFNLQRVYLVSHPNIRTRSTHTFYEFLSLALKYCIKRAVMGAL